MTHNFYEFRGGAIAPGAGKNMGMPGSKNVALHRRLVTLTKKAAEGDEAAMGKAQLLDRHLELELQTSSKKEDDRVKVLSGAWLASEISSGRAGPFPDASGLLAGLGEFLTRPQERLAILGEDGKGSPAFWRVFGRTP